VVRLRRGQRRRRGLEEDQPRAQNRDDLDWPGGVDKGDRGRRAARRADLGVDRWQPVARGLIDEDASELGGGGAEDRGRRLRGAHDRDPVLDERVRRDVDEHLPRRRHRGGAEGAATRGARRARPGRERRGGARPGGAAGARGGRHRAARARRRRRGDAAGFAARRVPAAIWALEGKMWEPREMGVRRHARAPWWQRQRGSPGDLANKRLCGPHASLALILAETASPGERQRGPWQAATAPTQN
jgi:hypothetical protein